MDEIDDLTREELIELLTIRDTEIEAQRFSNKQLLEINDKLFSFANEILKTSTTLSLLMMGFSILLMVLLWKL